MINVGSVSVDIVPNAQGFDSKLKAAIRNVSVQVKAELDASGIRRQIDEIARDVSMTINVHLDDASAKTRLDELARAREAKVNVTADTAEASARIDEVARNRRSTINVDADTGGAQTQIAGIGSAASGSAGSIRGNLIAAGLAIAPAIIPAAGAAAAAIAGIGVASIAAGAGLGVLLAGVVPIVKAVTEQAKASQQATSAVSGLRQAQQGLAAAQYDSASAARRAGDAVVNAQRGVVSARQSASRAVAAAIQQEQQAEQNLSNALEREKQAQLALTQARIDAKRALQDLNNAAVDGALASRQAALDLAKAKADLDQAQAAAASTDPNVVKPNDAQLAQLQLQYDQAVQGKKEADLRASRASSDAAKANKAGVEGSSQVKSAKSNLSSAQQGVDDARQGVDQAQAAVYQARVDGAKRVRAAEQAVTDAEVAQRDQAIHSARAVQSAQDRLIAAQKTLARSTAATDGLTKPGRELATLITGSLIPGFKDLSKLGQAPIAQGIIDGLNAMKPLLPVVKDLFANLGGALGEVFRQAGKALGSPFWVDFFKLVADKGGPAIEGLGKFLGRLITGTAGIFKTFQPVGKAISGLLQDLAKRFEDFGTGKTDGLEKFLRYAEQVGPKVSDFIGALASAVGNVVKALAPLGGFILDKLTSALRFIARQDPKKLGLVASGVVAFFAAFKGFQAVSGALAFISGGPLGLALGAIAAAVLLMDPNTLKKIGGALKDMVKALEPKISGTVKDLKDFLSKTMKSVSPSDVKALADGVGKFAVAMLGLVDALIKGRNGKVDGWDLGQFLRDLGDSAGAAAGGIEKFNRQVGPMITFLKQLDDLTNPSKRKGRGPNIPVAEEWLPKWLKGWGGLFSKKTWAPLNTAMNQAFDKYIVQPWNKMWAKPWWGTSNWGPRLLTWFKSGWAAVVNSPFWATTAESFKGIGRDIMAGLKHGIVDSVAGLLKSWNKVCNDVIDWVKKLFGIKSPSTVFAGIGRDIIRGLVQGIRSASRSVERAWDGVVKAFKDAWDAIKRFVRTGIKYLSDKIHDGLETIKRKFSDIWGKVRDATDALLGKNGSLRSIFRQGVAALGEIWKGLQDLAKAPVVFIIDTVINKGLIGAYQWVRGFLPGLPDIKPVKIPGFRSGGPTGDHLGRDQVAGVVHGGEHVATAEEVSSTPGGHKTWANIRRAVREGDTEFLHDIPGYAQGGSVSSGSGSSSKKITNPDQRVSVNGHALSKIAALQIALASQISGIRMSVMQGGFGGSHIAASGKSHNWPGVADVSPGSVKAEKALRQVGFAAWARNIAGRRSVGSGAHVHSVSLIDPGNKGQGQIASWNRGGDGYGGHDPAPHYSWIPNLLERLGATNLSALGGSGGGGGIDFMAYARQFASKVKVSLDKLNLIDKSPFGKMVAAVPNRISTAMVDKVKSVAEGLMSSVTSPVGTVTGALLPGSNKSKAKQLMPGYGFNVASQFPPLDKLWTRESGWRTTAKNPSSGAYGIPQALPGSKMASAGSDWRTNPATQIKWGLGYIKDRYGSPGAAWAHSQRTGWYDQGGWLQPGTTVVHNNTGKPEPVFTGNQFEKLLAGRGGPTLKVENVNGLSADDVAEKLFTLMGRQQALHPTW